MAETAAAADVPGGDDDVLRLAELAAAEARRREPADDGRRAGFRRYFYAECLRIAVEHWRETRSGRRRCEPGGASVWREQTHGWGEHQAGGEVDPDVVFDILEELQEIDADAALVAKLKLFERRPDEQDPGRSRGLTNREVAAFVDCSLRKVEKDWAYAKAFLFRRLSGLQDKDAEQKGTDRD